MRRKQLIFGALSLALVALSFVAGRGYQNAKTGYHFKLSKTQEFPFPQGQVKLQHAFEWVGWGFMTPETSIIQYSPSPGLSVVLYKAERAFQENSPFVSSVSTGTNGLFWTDNINNYQLMITPLQEGAEQSLAPLPSAPRTGPSEGAR